MDLARATIKHRTLIVKSFIKRLDSLGDGGEDISEQIGYLHAKYIYADYMNWQTLE